MALATVPSGGSFVITATFRDEQGNLVIPSEIKWTLVDGGGSVINSRQDVNVTPASTVRILLGEDDNPPLEESERYLTITARYTSSLLPGEPMVLVRQVNYYVNNLVEAVA